DAPAQRADQAHEESRLWRGLPLLARRAGRAFRRSAIPARCAGRYGVLPADHARPGGEDRGETGAAARGEPRRLALARRASRPAAGLQELPLIEAATAVAGRGWPRRCRASCSRTRRASANRVRLPEELRNTIDRR